MIMVIPLQKPLKVKLLNSSYEKDIAEIDQRAKALFEVYNNNNNERKHDR